MKSHRRYTLAEHSALKVFIATLVVLYGVVAYEGGARSPRGEYFPVFNWSLFSHVGSVRGLAEIRVHSIGDTRFEKPADYFTLDSYFASARNRSTDLRKSLDRFGRAYMSGRAQEADEWRRLVELRHLSGRGRVKYEIVGTEFNPLERWKTGRVRREFVLGQFETDP